MPADGSTTLSTTTTVTTPTTPVTPAPTSAVPSAGPVTAGSAATPVHPANAATGAPTTASPTVTTKTTETQHNALGEVISSTVTTVEKTVGVIEAAAVADLKAWTPAFKTFEANLALDLKTHPAVLAVVFALGVLATIIVQHII